MLMEMTSLYLSINPTNRVKLIYFKQRYGMMEIELFRTGDA